MTKNQLLNRFHIKEKLSFDYDNGQINLDANRMLLMHADSISRLHHELFEALDEDRAQGVLLRMGFTSGQLDADLVLNLDETQSDFDVFDLGPAIHGLEGIVQANIVEYDIDWEQGSFYGQVELSNSVEADNYLKHNTISQCPVCWSVVGYASGYASRYFKRFIVFKEVECRACGDERCRLVGKPVEAWGDDDYVQYFKADYPGIHSLESELLQLRGQAPTPLMEQGKLLGKSPAFLDAFSQLKQATQTPINVLLNGETGVGKEVFARWLHSHSDRADKPFVAINCGAIPNDLIEAELFGVKRGAFTGAEDSRPGRFERADGGILFLDELGELSLQAQVKLLRVLQTGELERLGDTRTVKVDVRLVAATNMDLPAAIADGRFRSDLYYRIATFPIEIPPLRARKADIPLLANTLVAEYAPLYRKQIKGISDAAMQTLVEYDWPGNIRELQNIIERAVLQTSDRATIERIVVQERRRQTTALPTLDSDPAPPQDPDAVYDTLIDAELSLQDHERKLIEAALAKTNGNMTQAAKLLGITRRQIAYKLRSAS